MSMSAPPAKTLEGKGLAQQIREGILKDTEAIRAAGCPAPKLAAIQVGQDPASDWYVGQQEKWAGKLGILFERVPASEVADQTALLKHIRRFNDDSATHGIFITMPLPAGFDSDEALMAMDPRKDVEGIHPASLGLIVLRKAKLIPPTAYAAFKLIEATGISLRGKKATFVGQSAIVGRPLQLMLGERRVTTTVCNTGTSEAMLEEAVGSADIVIACAGSPGLVRGEWIRPGAVVIDVGTNEVDGKLVGDVEYETARERAGFITPVPGGVGPLTVTMLMQNLIHACRWQHAEGGAAA